MKKLVFCATLIGAFALDLAPLQASHAAASASASTSAAAAAAAPAYKDNAELVSAYMRALFVDRKLAEIEKFWGKDMIQHNPTMPNGHERLREVIGKIGPEFSYQQGLIMQKGDMVMVHGRYVGWAPKPLVAVDIFRIENGKIAEHWDVMQEEVPASQSVNGHAMFPAQSSQ